MRFAPLFALAVACSSSQQPALTNHATTQPIAVAPSNTRGLEFRVVDSTSQVMQRIFQHVGFDSDGKPTDPMAISAGILTEVDVWADPIEGATRHTDYRFVAKDRATLERYLTTIATKDPALALPKDREFGYEKMDDGTWKSYLLERSASLDGSTIANVTRSTDPNTGRVLVLLDFDATGAKALAEVTKRITGKKLAIVFNGVVKSAPIINSEIAGGKASITMGGTTVGEQETEAQTLVDALNRK